MPVCSYYCASCGQKLSPDDARYGRPKLKAIDWYCRTCASELDLEPIEAPAGGAAAADEARPRRSSGRTWGKISGRVPPPPPSAPDESSPAPGRSPAPIVAAVAGGLLLLGGFVFFLSRGDAEPVGRAPAPVVISQAAASRPSVADAPITPVVIARAPSPEVAHVEAPAPNWAPPVSAGPADAMPSEAPQASPREPAPPPAPASSPTTTPAGPAPAAAKPPETPPSIPPATPLAEALVGNKNSKKVHKPDCRWAQKITDKNRASFASLDEARKAGFEPCKECLGH